MEDVPISVTIQKVVIIVSVLLDISFNLTITIVKVNSWLLINSYITANLMNSYDVHFCCLLNQVCPGYRPGFLNLLLVLEVSMHVCVSIYWLLITSSMVWHGVDTT